MSQKSKFVVALFVVLLATAGVLIGLSVVDDRSKVSQEAEQARVSQVTYVTYGGQEGKTALDILKSINKVETKKYSGIGEMVLSIDGSKPKDSSQFWAFYVNGTQAQVGADQYVTKNGEKIEWKLETIQ